MPLFMKLGLPLLLVFSLVPLVLIARARGTTMTHTRLQPIQDMGQQPKFLPQSANPLFADGRAMRGPVEHTVARGEIEADEPLTQGTRNGAWSKDLPLPVTLEALRRGQDRFDIYCAVCHGLSGYGDGMVAVRSQELKETPNQSNMNPPSSYHTDAIRERENGSIFNTITNGIRTMPPYGAQIDVRDRWKIVMYVRALQRSQNASLEDVPAEKRGDLR